MLRLALLSSLTVMVQATLPSDYTALTAQDKQAELMSNLEEDEGQSNAYPSPLANLKLLVFNLRSTFEHRGDEMPKSREKVIHPVGVVGTAEFIPTRDSPFTGHFAGSKHVIIRLSSAGEPTADNLKPGIALKFLEDGHPSLNVVALHTLEGQTSGNFFQETFSNHFRGKKDISWIEQRIFDRFEKVNHPETWVGCSDLAATTPRGEDVSEAVTPFQLFFVPNAELSRDWADVSPLEYLDKLVSDVPSGSMLYTVEGSLCPHDTTRVKMGELVLTSGLIKSSYGDGKLFFQHQYIEKDFARNPEWKDALPHVVKKSKLCSGCPFYPSKRSLRLEN